MEAGTGPEEGMRCGSYALFAATRALGTMRRLDTAYIITAHACVRHGIGVRGRAPHTRSDCDQNQPLLVSVLDTARGGPGVVTTHTTLRNN